MSETFVDLLVRLVKANVRFVLIGGCACIVHGGTQTTEDIDICCDFSAENLLRLQKAIEDLHPVHRMTPQRLPLQLTAENAQNLNNLYLDTNLGQLDCVGTVQGLGKYNDIKTMCDRIELDGVKLCVLNRNALIDSKKAMNRPRDREAVRQLEAIKKLDTQ